MVIILNYMIPPFTFQEWLALTDRHEVYISTPPINLHLIIEEKNKITVKEKSPPQIKKPGILPKPKRRKRET